MKFSTIFRKALCVGLSVATVAFSGFAIFEPTLAGAVTSTQTTVVTLNVTTGISVTGASTANMSQALGVATNDAVGTTSITVITNDTAGYTLTVQATNTPAMTSGANSVLDYQTNAPNTWNATTGSAYFGYSAFGTDVATSTWGTGAVCSAAADGNATSTTLKYKGFTTSGVQIASRSSTTTPSGTTDTICYAVEQRNYFVPSGTYNATITVTGTAS